MDRGESSCIPTCRLNGAEVDYYEGIDYDALAKKLYDATLDQWGTDSKAVYDVFIEAVGKPLQKLYQQDVISGGCGGYPETVKKAFVNACGLDDGVRTEARERLKSAFGYYVMSNDLASFMGLEVEIINARKNDDISWNDTSDFVPPSEILKAVIIDEMFGNDRLGVLYFGGFAAYGHPWELPEKIRFGFATMFNDLDWKETSKEDCVTLLAPKADKSSDEHVSAEWVCFAI